MQALSPDGGEAAIWLQARVVERRELDAGSGLTWLRLDAVPQVAAAGQYVQVITADASGADVVRYVSLASPPGAPAELLVGRGANAAEIGELCGLRVGEALRISALAAGRLTLQSVPRRPVLWLFAAGTGLAPLRAIAASDEPSSRFERVVLVHSARHPRQLAFADEFASRHAAGDLTYVPMVSGAEHRDDAGSLRPIAALWGRIPAAIDDGRLEDAAGASLAPSRAAALICGGGAMVEATRAALERRGLHRHDPQGAAPSRSPDGTIVTEW